MVRTDHFLLVGYFFDDYGSRFNVFDDSSFPPTSVKDVLLRGGKLNCYFACRLIAERYSGVPFGYASDECRESYRLTGRRVYFYHGLNWRWLAK